MASLLQMLAVAVLLVINNGLVEATWCVVRSDASDQALQRALDYACGAGADCLPIQSSGLCYLPNTIQAHASYAFNSFYQRRANDPASCVFSGTATVAKTDPSYGSCVYPSSPSTAGGTGGTGTTTTNTSLNSPPPPGTTTFGDGGVTPGLAMPSGGPIAPDTNNSRACLEYFSINAAILITTSCFLVLSFMYQPMKVFGVELHILS